MASSSTAFELNIPIKMSGLEGSFVTILGKKLAPNVHLGKYKFTADSEEQDVAVKVFDRSNRLYDQEAIDNERDKSNQFSGSPYVVTFMGYHCDLSGSLLVTEKLPLTLEDILAPKQDSGVAPAVDDDFVSAPDDGVAPAVDDDFVSAPDDGVAPAVDDDFACAPDDGLAPAVDDDFASAPDDGLAPAVDDDFASAKYLTGLKLLNITLNVASALQEIHEAKHIHKDIKPANIFLDEEGEAKVGDFGLTVPADHEQSRCGTLDFMAPEFYVEPGMRIRITEKVDIYSLGMTMLFMSHGYSIIDEDEVYDKFMGSVQKFHDLKGEQLKNFFKELPLRKDIRQLDAIQKRMFKCSPEYFQLILDCTRLNPDERPSAARVVERVKGLIAQSELHNEQYAKPESKEMEEEGVHVSPLPLLPRAESLPLSASLLNTFSLRRSSSSDEDEALPSSLSRVAPSSSSSSSSDARPGFSLTAPALPHFSLFSVPTSSSSSSSSDARPGFSLTASALSQPRLFSAPTSSSSSSSSNAQPGFSLTASALSGLSPSASSQ